jgi:hypothetical protein
MVSRWAIAVFAVFFSAYDAAAGIATGYALRNAQGLSAEGQAAVYEAVIDMPGLSLIFGLSIVGTGAWVVALIATAIALRRAGAPLGPFIFADTGRGVPYGRASLPRWHACLRVFLPGHRVARARPWEAHFS